MKTVKNILIDNDAAYALAINSLESAIIVLDEKIEANNAQIKFLKEVKELAEVAGKALDTSATEQISTMTIATLMLRNRDLNRTKRSLTYLKTNWK